jgi:hypothetical protein
MKFLINIAIKIFFLVSTMPFLVSEKLYDRYEFRLNNKVIDSLYRGPEALGELKGVNINEASGLAVSNVHPAVLYTHNDSGGDPEVFMIDTLGQYQGKIILEGVKNKDWEDIAVGPGEYPDSSYIYVGDIGDNDGKREKIQVYRFPEPTKIQEALSIKPQKINLVYPDGPRDAETLIVDPWTGDIFVLSKRDTSNILYRAPAEDLGKREVKMEKIMKLPITMAVAGDISADGKQIVIKNYWVVYYWLREEGESVPEALARKPLQLPYKPEPQGEAIAFSTNGDRFYTLSENRFRIKPVLYQYKRITSFN